MLNYQFHLLPNAFAEDNSHAAAGDFQLKEPDIPTPTLRSALITVLEYCGAKIEPDMTVTLEEQKKCFDKYFDQFYENDANLTIETLKKNYPEPPLTNITINDLLRLSDHAIRLPEVLDGFRSLVDDGVYDDLPSGLDSVIDRKTWAIASHYYLMATEEKYLQMFVNYPEDKTLRTWDDLGLTEDLVAIYEATFGKKFDIDLKAPVGSVKEFLKFKIECATLFQGTKVLRIDDFVKVSDSWDMPVLFHGALLDKPHEWFPEGETPESLMSLSQTIDEHYTKELERWRQYEAEMSLGDADESEADEVQPEIPVETTSELDAEVEAVL